jgi:hypothetical protein
MLHGAHFSLVSLRQCNKWSNDAGCVAPLKLRFPEERKATAIAAAEAKCKEKEEMTDWTDSLASLLFGKEQELVNLKLLRGDNPHVSEKDLRSEVHRALLQVSLGTSVLCNDFPEERGAKRTDMSVLVNI